MEPSNRNSEIPVLLIYDLDRKHWGPFEINFTLDKIERLTNGLKDLGYPLTTLEIRDSHLEEVLLPYSPERFILFNLCEELPGIPHNAGLVGEIIEKLGFTHTGSDPCILTFSQDKTGMKELADGHGIPTPAWQSYNSLHQNGWSRFPAIVKPSLEHCSVGIDTLAVVNNPNELSQRIDYVIQTFNQPALVEDFIDGREFRISVIGNDNHTHMLPPVEIDYSSFDQDLEHLLTYDSKMNPESRFFRDVKLNEHPELTSDEYQQLEMLALKIFHVLECRDYAGFDFRLKDGVFYLLDANPDPEFSHASSMVLGAAKEGLSYAGLAGYIIHEAARRHPILKSMG